MKISVLTKQGNSKKLNADSMLFVSEDTKDNPILIDSQSQYSHYVESNDSFIAVIADGLGSDEAALVAAKTVVAMFFKHSADLLGNISEQDIMYNISDLFVRIELEIAKTVSQDKTLVGASASLAGILYNKSVGLFTFNAGDVRVYKKDTTDSLTTITKDHTSKDGTIENFAGGGGNHYITSTGAISKLPMYHIIASRGLYENDKFLNAEFDNIYSSGDCAMIIDKAKNILSSADDTASLIHIMY